MEYKTPTSATETEFEITTLTMYHAGAIKYAKRYNQNHFLISFSPKA